MLDRTGDIFAIRVDRWLYAVNIGDKVCRYCHSIGNHGEIGVVYIIGAPVIFRDGQISEAVAVIR